MTTIRAEVVLSSESTQSLKRLSTLVLRYPRFIHAELMTHRVFSRNAASSRAIPVNRLIDEALVDPAVPKYWVKNQAGMQGFQPMEEKEEMAAKMHWDIARLESINRARAMAECGAHKQLVNRLLEPYIHITTLVSATEWDNFFELRNHAMAEPHLRDLAREIEHALDTCDVQRLEPGGWHLPFVQAPMPVQPDPLDVAMSIACCASTSYKTVEGYEMSREKARAICDKLLVKPLHASPLEHVAFVDQVWNGTYLNFDCHRNYVGFAQLRAMIERGDMNEKFQMRMNRGK